jgi:hypothetical protein
MITLDPELLDRAMELPLVAPYSNEALPDEDGFKFLGAGCERTVWLGPDGNVYKCEMRDGANVKEYNQSLRLRGTADLPCWIYIPETAYDAASNIVVAEYIDGREINTWDCYDNGCDEDGCAWSVAMEAFEFIGSFDGHPGNCKVFKGNAQSELIVALIDFTR